MDVYIQVDVSKNLTDPTSCTSQTVDLTKGANKTNDIKQSYFVVYTGIVGENMLQNEGVTFLLKKLVTLGEKKKTERHSYNILYS